MTRQPNRLRRDHEEVLLHDPFDPPFLLRFRSAADVARYLRYWRNSPDAMATLREAMRSAGGPPTRPIEDDEVIEVVARLVHSGALALSSRNALHDLPASLRPPETPASAISAAVPLVPKIPVPPLLPRLELIQIGAADVLIEVKQGLGEVRSAMAAIQTTGVSLEPVPAGVPPIQSGIAGASAAIQSTLSKL